MTSVCFDNIVDEYVGYTIPEEVKDELCCQWIRSAHDRCYRFETIDHVDLVVKETLRNLASTTSVRFDVEASPGNKIRECNVCQEGKNAEEAREACRRILACLVCEKYYQF